MLHVRILTGYPGLRLNLRWRLLLWIQLLSLEEITSLKISMQTANHELCHYYLARPGKPHIKFRWGGMGGGERHSGPGGQAGGPGTLQVSRTPPEGGEEKGSINQLLHPLADKCLGSVLHAWHHPSFTEKSEGNTK